MKFNYKAFGRLVKIVREARGVTLRNLATETGISIGTLSKMQYGSEISAGRFLIMLDWIGIEFETAKKLCYAENSKPVREWAPKQDWTKADSKLPAKQRGQRPGGNDKEGAEGKIDDVRVFIRGDLSLDKSRI